jgi:hypothetical protein
MAQKEHIKKLLEPEKSPFMRCAACDQEKRKEKDFYISYNKVHTTGRLPYCKLCLKDMICNDTGSVSLDKLKQTLKLIHKPYIYDLWNSSLATGGDVFGQYMKNLALPQNRLLTYENSMFDSRVDTTMNYDTFYQAAAEFRITPTIVKKWGGGYQLEEYEAFERKYDSLKNNYSEKTAMHTEALFKYIRYSVKEEMATAKDDPSNAKIWGSLAKDAANAAKITPSQLSKSDLQDGLTTFGQLAREVEKAVDIIPILPKFKKKPQDRADFVLFCYANYIRDIKDMPPCTYEEVYSFYEKRKKEYEDGITKMANYVHEGGDM